MSKKVVLITGSTSGIGEATARLFNQNGFSIVLNSANSVDKGQALSKELKDAIYCQGDIQVESDCEKVIDQAIHHFGQLDVLVNNAGISMRKRGDVFDIPNADFTQVLTSNVVGTWCMMRNAMPYLQKSSNGCIVNISSCAGVDPGSESSAIAYSVSKAAINHLTKLTAKYSGPIVRVNAIAPGLILTPRTKNFDEAIDKFKDRTPLKRVGEPNDIAELILAMVKSKYINGEVVLADGGFSTV